MPYAKIDGKWKQVNSYTASQLGKAGYTISYTAPAIPKPGVVLGGDGSGYDSSTSGFGFTIYSPELGFDRSKAPAQIQKQYDEYQKEFDATVNYRDPASPAYDGNMRSSLAVSQMLTTDERAAFDYITKNMEDSFNENPRMWWTYIEGNDQSPAGYYAKRTGMVDLEQMASKGGDSPFGNMSDRLLGAVQRWYQRKSFVDPAEGVDTGTSHSQGGGGGGGYGSRNYVQPDRRTVTDAVKAQLFALTGETDEARVSKLTDAWLAAHRKSWDIRQTGGEDVDPNATTLAMIREQANYKQIHELRSEGDDEMRWIAERRQRLSQLGVTSANADERAIQMAQLGTNVNDISTSEFQAGKGMEDVGMLRNIRNTARQIAEML